MYVAVAMDGQTIVSNIEGSVSAIAQGVEVKLPVNTYVNISPGNPPETPLYTTQITTTLSTATTSGDTLGEILGRTDGIVSMKYDWVITAPGGSETTMVVWVKKTKIREEVTQKGQTYIILADMDTKTLYNYIPAQNMAIKMTWDPTPKSATDEATSILDYNPTVLGTETIDGKVCIVVQYTVREQATKMWLWQDQGLPLRVEATTTQGITIMEYKNIQFIDIPDSMFTLPDGVQITQMPIMPTEEIIK
jgi:outer membrane lipoprotein-sorting protein